jgi:hypothetical protein
MSKRISTCVVSMPARDLSRPASSQEPSEPGRVLDFAKPDDKSEDREKPSLARREKIRRIVDSAIEKMDDDQLEALVIAIEEITGCHSGGHSE